MASSNNLSILHKQHQSPFLSLPFEVRYQIYKDMVNLSQATFWSYRGLYLACKAIHTEMTSFPRSRFQTIRIDCSMVHTWENRNDMSQMTFRQMVALTGMDTDSPRNTRRINYMFDFDEHDHFEQFTNGAGYAHLRDWQPWTKWYEDSAQEIVWVKSVKGEEQASYQWMRSSLRAGWWTRRHNLTQRQGMEVKMDVARRHEKGEPHGSVMVSSGRILNFAGAGDALR
ncbi:hypothetical protein BDU57DRAFT_592811 [Ampelomyces quisqualis]|uniref:Uncharacterized protein n=1 Tax=Ampelomyces quisqualis TaxID=50730 RepID=A0A6A5QV38_AMPQU|nr:hypothetical protein BDU57DRAFT_592811 [Ampelomyces quisqualis]